MRKPDLARVLKATIGRPELSSIANSINLFSPERQSAGRVLKAKAEIAERQLGEGEVDSKGVPLMVGNRKQRRHARNVRANLKRRSHRKEARLNR